jgi:hypothetical protein
MKAKLQALWAGLKSQLLDIWNRSKMFLLAGLAVAIYLGWNSLKEMVLAYFGKKEIQKDNKEDTSLKAKEDSANNQADALVKESNDLPSKEKPVSEDWYKDQK